jgi:di/tricarboxylate transporter
MKRAKVTGPVAAIICTAIAAPVAVVLAVDDVTIRTAALALLVPVFASIAAYLRSPRDTAVGE